MATSVEAQFQKVIEFFEKELSSLRTGRANPALVENVRVDYFGTPTPLQQLASITTPEPRMILIEAWDPTVVPAIEKAILQSELGFNPTVDGNRVRVPLPQLTEERRQELVKLAKQKAESARVSIRAVREEHIKELKRAEKAGEQSEDELSIQQKDLQKLVEKQNAAIEQALKHKEEEIVRI